MSLMCGKTKQITDYVEAVAMHNANEGTARRTLGGFTATCVRIHHPTVELENSGHANLTDLDTLTTRFARTIERRFVGFQIGSRLLKLNKQLSERQLTWPISLR
jgi:hypothetical protein